MAYEINNWQEASPAWRDWQIFKCLCDLNELVEAQLS